MSRRTEFASTWWAQRWIRLLERFGWSARLNRGRAYARHGNVLDIDIQSGLVRAKVQGSRKAPYRVEIGLKPLGRSDWDRVFHLLRRKAVYAAKLLSGEMPRDIEEIFKAAEVPLFPRSGEDLVMSCTCPDWASPCKHVAAVYYVLGSEFDRDPFLLFELRGRSKEQVMTALRGGRRNERTPGNRAPRISSEPLEEHLNDFWQAGDELDDVTIRVQPPPVPQAILKRLGPLPLRDLPEEWYGDLARMYETVSKDALAFVNVSGSARAPQMGPQVPVRTVNGASNGDDDTPVPDEFPEATILSEDVPANGDILSNGHLSDVAGQILAEETDDQPPQPAELTQNGAANGQLEEIIHIDAVPDFEPPEDTPDEVAPPQRDHPRDARQQDDRPGENGPRRNRWRRPRRGPQNPDGEPRAQSSSGDPGADPGSGLSTDGDPSRDADTPPRSGQRRRPSRPRKTDDTPPEA